MLWAQEQELADQLIAWEESKQSDSIDFYYPKLAETYRKDDLLADFLYAYWDWQSYWFEETDRALAILDSVLAKQWRRPENADEGEALWWVQTNRAYHLTQRGRILESVKTYETALRLYRRYELGLFEIVDYLFLPLGAHYTRLGDNEKAQGIYQEAIKIADEQGNVENLAGLYSNLGVSYWNAGQYEQAIAACQKGLSLTEVPSVKKGLLQLSLARSLFDQKQFEEARASLQMARYVLQRLEDSKEALDYLSGVFVLQGELDVQKKLYEAADQSFDEALRLGRAVYGDRPSRDVGKIYIHQGNLYLRQEKIKEAIAAFNQAMQSVLPSFEPVRPEENPAPTFLYEENTLMDALAGKAEALSRQYTLEQDSRLLQDALACYGLAYQVESRLRASFQYESSKLKLLADSRRQTEGALAAIYQLYRESRDVNLVKTALEWMERAKSVVLLDALQDNLARNAIKSKDSLLQKEWALKKQLAYFERRLILQVEKEERTEWTTQKFRLEEQLDQIGRDLSEKYPQLQNYRGSDNRLDWPTFERELLPDSSSVFISYFVGEKFIYGLAIENDGSADLVRLGESEQIQARVFAFVQELNDPNTEILSYQASAETIYKDLLAPFFFGKDDNDLKICIASDGWLNNLPFDILCRPEKRSTPGRWRQLDFLLRRYQIHYTYSAQVALLQAKKQYLAKRSARLIAPLFPDGNRDLAPLPESRLELKAVAPACSHILLGRSADYVQSLANIEEYETLHFSTHAQAGLDGQGPRIELYDQALYLPEIYALNLQARLAILSACETGLGRLEEGEGVMSLARAFTYAGAGGLISSLWSVNAQSTTKMMQGLYEELKNGSTNAFALRQAKLSYLNSEKIAGIYKSPYYWAGFVYIGPPKGYSFSKSYSFCRLKRALAIGGIILLLLGIGLWFKKRLKSVNLC